MRKAILHIGAEKTGTTTIQRFLRLNCDLLTGLGFAYLKTPGDKSQTKLAAYAVSDDRVDFIRNELEIAVNSSASQFRETLKRDLGEEIAALPSGVQTVIFSNEHLQSRLQTEAEISRLKTLLDSHFDSVEVIVYLRRQDELAASLYSTFIRSGGTRDTILPDVDPEDPFYNFDQTLDRWAHVFDDAALTVKLFVRQEMENDDVVTDFLKTCGIPHIPQFRKAPDGNVALDPLAIEFLRHTNELIPAFIDGQINPEHGPLDVRLESAFGGKGRVPARDQVEKFYDLFRASNQRLCRRWFPGRDTLFSEDFSRYPESADMVQPSFSDAVKIAAELWRSCWNEERRLLCEIALRDAERAVENDDLMTAQAFLTEALELQPHFAEAHHRLAALFQKLGRKQEAEKEARRAMELSPDSEIYRRFFHELSESAA